MAIKLAGLAKRQTIGLLLGVTLCILLLLLPVPDGMPPAAMKVAAITLLMASWWISEAIPIPATALVPIGLFPLLGVMSTADVTASYANHLVYLFMGGFLIAMAIERWQLHRRIALHTVSIIGTSPARIVLGFMFTTAFLSSWISNTAAAMLMVTIGIAVIRQAEERRSTGKGFGTALMLGIAYGASIGGVATLIGSPPNAILAGIVEQQYGRVIGFAEWMLFGLPLSLVMLALAWLHLTRVAFRLASAQPVLDATLVRDQLRELGPMSRQERAVLLVFLTVVAAWLLRGLVDLPAMALMTDSAIAILGALALFIIPADLKRGEFLLDWQTAVRIPWDIIVLFGGGFALAKGFGDSGLTVWIGQQLTVLQGVGPIVILVAVVLLVIFLTEVTSNTATASLLLPVMAGFALAMQTAPLPLMVATALAASFAFMLPVATPPNAIVFSSRAVTIPQMARVGIWLNLLGVLVISGFVLLVLPLVW